MTKEEFLDAVQKERAYQETKWGATDHLNTEYNWAGYIGAYATRTLIGDPMGIDPGIDRIRRMNFRADMVKVAALAMAAAESLE
jgi:hypothetical protein